MRLLPLVQRRRVRALLGYDPATAGGLMSPEFVCVYTQATRRRGARAGAQLANSAEALAWIYVMNTRQRLVGAVALVDLLRADPDGLGRRDRRLPQRVRPDADLEEVARLMTDFDLTVVPVVDERGADARRHHRRRRARARPAARLAAPVRALRRDD